MTQLTPHFTLEEFTLSETAARKGYDNVPPAQSRERKNLHRMAETMEKIRAILDSQPVLISSGYRCPPLNAAVGGSKSSAHMSGLACDFICPNFGTPLEVCKALDLEVRALGLDQLIYEFETWVHVGLRDGQPRHMVLTIDAKGTRNGLG